jgi:hypothetical protein
VERGNSEELAEVTDCMYCRLRWLQALQSNDLLHGVWVENDTDRKRSWKITGRFRKNGESLTSAVVTFKELTSESTIKRLLNRFCS